MKILAVDDEPLSLKSLVRVIKELEPEAEIAEFTNITDVFSCFDRHFSHFDIAFLDIEMAEMSGLLFAEECARQNPQMNIIFVTGHSQYAMDALKLHVSGYLMKPVRKEDLRKELDHLRYPIALKKPRRVFVQTFGNFELFVDNKPLALTSSKAKECLAYLIDRKGAKITFPEIASALWEEKPYDRTTQNNLHQVLHSLMKELKKAGIEEIIIKTHKDMAINIEKVECDYYMALNGDKIMQKHFADEYMSQYSWGELTLAMLYNLFLDKKS